MGGAIADLDFPEKIVAECVNTPQAPFDLSNNFGVTAGGTDMPEVEAKVVAPAGGTLNVPASGATFRVTAVNRGPTETLSARPRYTYPFGDPDNKQFKVAVCETNTAGTCLAPFSDSVNYTATKNVTKRFAVRVTRPAANPGFEPGLRRVFLYFRKPDFFSVGAASVAPKRL